MTSAVAGRRVLVTGAAGFLGSHLVRGLLEAGAEVVAIVRPTSSLERLADATSSVELLSHDLETLDPKASGPVDVVFHLAARGVDPKLDSGEEALRANVAITYRALELARESGASRFVCAGSCYEYGPGSFLHEDRVPAPVSEYGAAKASSVVVAHAYGRRYGLPVVVLRPFTVYGPAEPEHRLVAGTIRALVEGRRPRVTSGRQSRDFVFVNDVADAFLCAATSAEATGETINVCTGTETTVREVVELAVGLSGSGLEPEYGAEPIRDTEVWSLSGDPQKARRILSWEAATPLREGLLRTLAAYRDEPAKAAAS